MVHAPADMQRMNILDPLPEKPVVDLVIRDHGGAGSLGDLDRITQVVSVAVRDKDVLD